MSIRKLLFCASLASLSACEEAVGPDRRGTSSFVFEIVGFEGQPAGAFVAGGELPPGTGPGVPPGNWAFAFRRGTAEEHVVITASRERSDGRYDAMTLQLPVGARAGQTLQFRELCLTQPDCAQMYVNFGVERGGSMQTGCAVVSGAGHVAALTGRRVAGSFSGSAECAGAFNGPILLQRGTFDVAVIAADA